MAQRRTGAPAQRGQRNDWLCAQCGTQNFARRQACFRCESPRTDMCAEVPADAMPRKMDDGPPQATLVVRGLGPGTNEPEVRALFSYGLWAVWWRGGGHSGFGVHIDREC